MTLFTQLLFMIIAAFVLKYLALAFFSFYASFWAYYGAIWVARVVAGLVKRS